MTEKREELKKELEDMYKDSSVLVELEKLHKLRYNARILLHEFRLLVNRMY